ncbi:CHASE2 domain-containing protein [Synechocystis sp. PCC 7339]|uniref:CHASE2 domain-containing protein n=1 Tax=unclassified Synechocystis TaxID=2640012 RepID=UPI001BAE7DB7|nr:MULTISPECIES: CHASE2 domain-containing protein [unclassified Synechocystis]QUS60958.1 CHASE2 domain-containing protein [Synechocystis sp. PCC 7338]UAJ73141.1 CHASE2 domain-containing protein [Synechocystis sp. PCC 7339]
MDLQLLVLKIIEGDFATGFTVALDVETITQGQNRSQRRDFYGRLPSLAPNLDLYQLHQQWVSEIITARTGQPQRRRGIRVTSKQAIASHYDQPQTEQKRALQQAMVQWLTSPEPGWQAIEKEIIRWSQRSTVETQLVIQLGQSLYQSARPIAATLAKLPWGEWPLLQKESLSPIHFAVNTCQYALPPTQVSNPEVISPIVRLQRYFFPAIRILHVLGNNEGIDLAPDQAVLAGLSHQGKKVEVVTLHQPDYQSLSRALKDGAGFDLFVYSGHSQASFDQDLAAMLLGQPGTVEGVTIANLRLAFQRAIANGLRVAVFNSCASAQLAEALLDTGLSTVISMQEEVADIVAHGFLDSFLRHYVQGKQSIFRAVRSSLTDLEEYDRRYPGVGWLPVIHHNPTVAPPLWEELRQQPQSIRRTGLWAVGTTILVLLLRWFELTQGLDLKLFDLMLRSQPVSTAVDERILVVTVDQNDLDILRQNGLQSAAGSDVISDGALVAALEKINSYQPRWLGLDIVRDLPISEGNARLQEVFQNGDRLLVTCGFADQQGEQLLPPPAIDADSLAFINMPIDRDQVIRRQLLFGEFSQTESCSTNQSLGLSLALNYLGEEDIFPAESPVLTLNHVTFTPLAAKSGVYRANEVAGYQILFLSLPRGAIREISLSTLFADTEQRLDLKDKVVLLGYGHKDKHSTALESDIPGVVIHGQMVKQILDAVLDEKLLLTTTSQGAELLWILFWVGLATGGILGVIVMDGGRRQQQLVIIGSLVAVSSSGWLVLWASGLWLPLASPLLFLLLMLGGVSVSKSK